MPGVLDRVLTRASRPGERREANLSEALAALRGTSTKAGPVVGPDTAMRLGAVWACVNLIADTGSTLPVDAYRKVNVDGRQVREGVEPPPPIVADPDPESDPISWRRMVFVSWLLRGNAYGLVTGRDRLGYPTGIDIRHPDTVTASRSGGRWEWRLEGRAIDRWTPATPDGDLWHVPAYVVPGSPVGLSPIRYAAETIGLGLAAQDHGREWFADGAHPDGVLTGPHTLDGVSDETIEKTRERFKEGIDRYGFAVLGGDLKYEPIQVDAQEAQFLETIEANKADVAMFFGVKPEMIGAKSGDSMTYANVEQRGLDFRTYTLRQWLTRFEAALTRLRPRPQFVKFNPDAVVSVDLKSRYEAHDRAVRGGWKSRNDVRETEDLPPIEDGDQYLWPPYSTAPTQEQP